MFSIGLGTDVFDLNPVQFFGLLKLVRLHISRKSLWLAQWWSHGGSDLNTKLVLLLCEGPMTVGEINVVVGRMTRESPSRPLVLPVCQPRVRKIGWVTEVTK